MKKNLNNILIGLGNIIFSLFILNIFSKIIPRWGFWYNFNPAFKAQMDAFLNWDFALSATPLALRHDYAWADGVYQLWGLGVPLLQLPFTVISKLMGLSAAPDRFIFYFLYAMVGMFFWSIFTSRSTKYKTGICFYLGAFYLVLFSFPLLNMLLTRFAIYEEVVAYAWLWSILSFSFLYWFSESKNPKVYISVSVLSGFMCLLRPTFFFYAIVTFILAQVLALSTLNKKIIIIGTLLFMFFPIFLLTANYIRFDRFFEFGYRLDLTGISLNEIALKFDYPYKYESFASAAKELFAALFTETKLNANRFYEAEISNSFSVTTRFREFYFSTYNFKIFSLLLLSWFLAIISIVFRKKEFFKTVIQDKRIILPALWSFVCFVLLFAFYLRSPSITSRYVIDFCSAIFIGIMSLYFFIQKVIMHFKVKNAFLIGVILGGTVVLWNFLELGYAKKINMKTYASFSKPASLINGKDYDVPEMYTCHVRLDYDLPFNARGWDYKTSCRVYNSTILFMKNFNCINVSLEKIESEDQKDYPLEDIQVKVGLNFLERIYIKENGPHAELQFCRNKSDQPAPKDRLDVLVFAWVGLRNFKYSQTPFKLISVKNGLK